MVNVHTDSQNITIHVSGTSTGGAIAGSSTRYYEQLAKEHMEQAGTYATQSSTSATLAGEYADDCQEAVEYVLGTAPTASVSKVGNVSTFIVTDKDGTTTTEIYDGTGLPPLGTTGQVLTKHSNNDYDVEWSTVDALPPQTGKEGKFLQTDGSQASWETVDLSSKQDITDNTLTTTDKTIVGAINEVNSKPSVTSLSALTDVTLTTPADGEVLKYNSTSQKWENDEGGGTWGSITGTLSNQTDLNNALNGKVSTSSLSEINPMIVSYVNGTSGYNIWANGYCEQWGETDASAGSTERTITFLKTFNNTNYVITHSSVDGQTSTAYHNFFNIYTKTTTSFKAKAYGSSNIKLDWKACGYLAEGEY